MMDQQKIEQLEQDVTKLKVTVNELTELVKGSTEKLYTVPQVAELLGLKPSGVNWHIRAGNLIASGKRYKKIKESELHKFISIHKKRSNS